MEIRSAEPSDLEAIASLIQSLAEYEKLQDKCSATAERLEPYIFGPNPLVRCLIAEVTDPRGQKTAAGFALYFLTFSTFLARPGIYLEDLFVRSDYRGAGIGRSLFQRLAKDAEELGCGRLEWAVLNWNEPAIGFYQRLGADSLDEWTVYRLEAEAISDLAAGRV